MVELDQKLKKSYQIRIFELPAAQKGAYGALLCLVVTHSTCTLYIVFLQRSYSVLTVHSVLTLKCGRCKNCSNTGQTVLTL